LPKAIREALHLKAGQRFPVRETGRGIELVPCEPPAELRGFLSGGNTKLDDIRERGERL
jgi:AbrB family looped-hinge helix DNA binding protein